MMVLNKPLLEQYDSTHTNIQKPAVHLNKPQEKSGKQCILQILNIRSI